MAGSLASLSYEELPIKINRIAYREFTRDPDLSFEPPQEDLEERGPWRSGSTLDRSRISWSFRLHSRPTGTWCQPSPLAVCPERVRAMKATGETHTGEAARSIPEHARSVALH